MSYKDDFKPWDANHCAQLHKSEFTAKHTPQERNEQPPLEKVLLVCVKREGVVLCVIRGQSGQIHIQKTT